VIATPAMPDHRRHFVVSVGEDVRADPDFFSDRSLDWEPAAVNLRLDTFDDDALAPCPRQPAVRAASMLRRPSTTASDMVDTGSPVSWRSCVRRACPLVTCRLTSPGTSTGTACTAAHRGPARHRYVARSLVALAPYYRK